MAQAPPLTTMYACAGIEQPADRLSCFDAAVAGLRRAETAGDVKVVAREAIVEAQRQSFGLTGSASVNSALTSTGIAPSDPEAIDSVFVTIAEATMLADGKYRFTLENGQVWEQVAKERVSRLGALPAKAEIRKAMLGSFMMKVDGGRATRVRRVK